jgi:DNA-binding response OmpR family regulator
MNIVYIEDDPNDATLVALYARAKQHNLVVVGRSSEAPKALADNPDLILIDLVLDQSREGYTIARDLRRQGCTQPIIAVTALATSQDQEECFTAGFTDILTKPYTIDQLAKVINHYTMPD